MNKKLKLYAELLLVYLIIVLIAAFSAAIVSLGGSKAIKIVLTLLVSIAMTAVPFIVCRQKKISFSDLGYSKEHIAKQLFIALCLFVISIFCVVVLPLLIGMNKTDVLSFKSSSFGILIFYILYDLFFIGFGEEFIFRGYFYNRLGTAVNSKLLAIILSSVLFGLMHYPKSHNILQILVTTLVGLFYGFSRYRIKNCTLLSVSAAHGLHDAVIITLSYILL